MIRDDIQLTDVLYGFESTLRIDYSLLTIDKIMNSSIIKLEDIYSVKLDRPLFDILTEQRFTNTGLVDFVRQLENNLKGLSMLLTVSLFYKSFADTLQSVEYCGYTRETLLTALKYLQDKDCCKEKDSFMPAIVASMDKVPLCSAKKLLIVMILLDRLGVSEGVSIISQYLYAGGVLID